VQRGLCYLFHFFFFARMASSLNKTSAKAQIQSICTTLSLVSTSLGKQRTKLELIMDTAATQVSDRSLRNLFDSLPGVLLAHILQECGPNRIHTVGLTYANSGLSAPGFDESHCKCSQNSIASSQIAILTLAAQQEHGNQSSRAKQMNFLWEGGVRKHQFRFVGWHTADPLLKQR
jgi:hypothetical protein